MQSYYVSMILGPVYTAPDKNFVRINFCTDTNICQIGSPFTRCGSIISVVVRQSTDIARALLGRYSDFSGSATFDISISMKIGF